MLPVIVAFFAGVIATLFVLLRLEEWLKWKWEQTKPRKPWDIIETASGQVDISFTPNGDVPMGSLCADLLVNATTDKSLREGVMQKVTIKQRPYVAFITWRIVFKLKPEQEKKP